MRIALLFLAPLALVACNRDNGGAVDEIVGHRWARAAAECDDTYFYFSRNMIDFVRKGQAVNSLPVRRVVTDATDPAKVTFVIEVDSALAVRPDPRQVVADTAMMFRIEGDNIRLVGQGALDKLRPGYPTLALRRCD